MASRNNCQVGGPKGSGRTVRSLFRSGRGINSSSDKTTMAHQRLSSVFAALKVQEVADRAASFLDAESLVLRMYAYLASVCVFLARHFPRWAGPRPVPGRSHVLGHHRKGSPVQASGAPRVRRPSSSLHPPPPPSASSPSLDSPPPDNTAETAS